MKTFTIVNLSVLPLLMVGVGLMLVGRVTAQTFTCVYSFSATPGAFSGTNDDGANPRAGLVASGKTMYGTTQYGGSSGNGTIFAVNTDGTGFTNLHCFTSTTAPLYTNSDGANPYAGLILSRNTLYGTAYRGGSSGRGMLFKVNTDGTSFTNLHNFIGGSGGFNPHGSLILSGSTLYGTASEGDSSHQGIVFKVNIDGTGFTNVHYFTGGSNGAFPLAGLILSDNTLYGTVSNDESSGYGTVFAVNTDGTSFTNLHRFMATAGSLSTNSDGAHPYAGLIILGNTLYGTALTGGSSGNGTIFAVNTDGTGFTNLHSFTSTTAPLYSNSDGANPLAGLILLGNTLYGTTISGGSSGNGTVFAINADGKGITNLHNFIGDSDGAEPYGGLILSGNTLYGTTISGGSSGNGTVFSLSFAPQLTITPSGTTVVLSWPTNVAGFDYTGFTLQSTTNLVSSAVWNAVSPLPVVVNGLNTVTNPMSGTQQYFRLSQ